MDFNYYSFILNEQERIYYTYETHSTKEEILDWAVRYNFISEKDIEKCSEVRMLSADEVDERNKELYKLWWNEHKNDNSLCGAIPPTIGEVQLD